MKRHTSSEGNPKPLMRMRKSLMETGRTRSIPEAIVAEIIARLPLRSIARFKTVCKQWRSVIESSYFRRLFVSFHKRSSSSWSLMFPTSFGRPITEAIGFHGCETWALPKSLGSYIMPFQRYPNLPASNYYYVDSSHGLIWIEVILETETEGMSFKSVSLVGNPFLQEWVEIPPPTSDHNRTKPKSLVTRVVNGVVSSFKLVRTCNEFIDPSRNREVNVAWRVYIYSSETGTWTFKRLFSSCSLERSYSYSPVTVNLNGILYLWERRLEDNIWERRLEITGPGVLVAHDLYAEAADAQSRVIPLPVPDNKYVRRCLTTSGEDLIYIEILYRRLKVWRLKNNNADGEWWHLSREEINMASVGFDVNCFPLGMNPFDTDIVYLWSRQHSCLVTGNLRTQEFTIHQDSENWSTSEGCWRINTSDSRSYMEATLDANSVIALSQFVLPQWMDPVPRPPN